MVFYAAVDSRIGYQNDVEGRYRQPQSRATGVFFFVPLANRCGCSSSSNRMKADFTRYLAPMADKLICVQDDVEAQGIALVCGLIGQFKSGEDKPRTGGWVHALPFMEHPTHWVFVMKYTNFPLPADNGWSAIFYPKSKTTFAEAEAELRKVP